MASQPQAEALRAEAVREDADLDTSSEAYARRFGGPIGRWFLQVQTGATLAALAGLGEGARVLDVGGGHAQVAPPLIEAGFQVTVVGSAAGFEQRLAPWLAAGRCRFRVADLHHLPYEDGAYDAVVCYRLLAHSVNWTRLVGELCRVARHRVVVDYPARRSVNVLSRRLFELKRSVEGVMTRRFSLYDRDEIAQAFDSCGFAVTSEQPQFLLPMALYRLTRSAGFARAAEWPGRKLGLTQLLGSPVIVRADRRPPA